MQDGRVALIAATYTGSNDAVLLLLKHGADPNCYTIEVCIFSVLRMIARKLNILVVYLKQTRASPLGWAVSKCSHTTIKALVDAGASATHKASVRGFNLWNV